MLLENVDDLGCDFVHLALQTLPTASAGTLVTTRLRSSGPQLSQARASHILKRPASPASYPARAMPELLGNKLPSGGQKRSSRGHTNWRDGPLPSSHGTGRNGQKRVECRGGAKGVAGCLLGE